MKLSFQVVVFKRRKQYILFQVCGEITNQLKASLILFEDKKTVYRHLTFFRCLERLLNNWEPSSHFFQEEKKSAEAKKKKSNSEVSYSMKKLEGIANFLKSPTNQPPVFHVPELRCEGV